MNGEGTGVIYPKIMLSSQSGKGPKKKITSNVGSKRTTRIETQTVKGYGLMEQVNKQISWLRPVSVTEGGGERGGTWSQPVGGGIWEPKQI